MKNLLPWEYFWPLSAIFLLLAGIGMFNDAHSATQYSIVDTGQSSCYDNTTEVDCPVAGEAFYGQDAQFTGNAPSYTDDGDETVTDNVTGLMWQQSPDTDDDGSIEAADKLTYSEATDYCEDLSLAGYKG